MMEITILGSGSGGPFQGRAYSAQALRVENRYFLLDCGEGTQMQLFRYKVKYERIESIFITHLHGDHIFGMAGLLTSFSLRNRQKPLAVYSPPGLRDIIEGTFKRCGAMFSYPITFEEVDPEQNACVFEDELLEVWTVPLLHRTPCCGWLFRTKPKPLNVDKTAIETYGLQIEQIKAAKRGEDVRLPDGRVIANKRLTLPPLPTCAYAYCTDTMPSETAARAVRGVDLLYHEATFTEEFVEEAALSGHSTAAQAAGIARAAGVGKLLLGHFSGRYVDTDLHVAEARGIFAESHAVSDGDVYSIDVAK
ncbi:MAG: ribonuclease Z [Saprospiraceae bacterium]